MKYNPFLCNVITKLNNCATVTQSFDCLFNGWKSSGFTKHNNSIDGIDRQVIDWDSIIDTSETIPEQIIMLHAYDSSINDGQPKSW